MSPRAAALAALAACAPDPVPPPRASEPGPPVHEPKDTSRAASGCASARDPLGDLAWIPRDARLTLRVDLRAPDLDAAAARLAREGPSLPGVPVVAGLALAQLDLQLAAIRAQLRAAQLDPDELLLLHDPSGAVVWILRVRCDLAALQAELARAWDVQPRTTARGPVAEPRAGFPFDVVFLADDRLALAPAGAGGKLGRWLEASPAPDPAAQASAPSPGEVLAAGPAAPIRAVFGGRGLLVGDAAAAPPGLAAWGDRLELAGPRSP